MFQLLKCTDIGDTVDCAVNIFPMYLQSQCVGMPRLVLKTLYKLSESPDTVSRGSGGEGAAEGMARSPCSLSFPSVPCSSPGHAGEPSLLGSCSPS